MFQSLAQGMASGIAGKGVINSALLESFVIHLRALSEFFYYMLYESLAASDQCSCWGWGWCDCDMV